MTRAATGIAEHSGWAELAGLIGVLGETVGPPWREEHRLAAAAALWALSSPDG